MKHSVIKTIVLISILILCLPMVSATGDSAGTSGPSSSQDTSIASSCDITNTTDPDPYCPIWDGDHATPDPFLVYELRKKTEEGKYGISSLQPPSGWRGLPTTGNVRVPVFLVDFSDAPHDPTQTAPDVQSKMFGDGNINYYPYESLKNYYQRSSYNRLTIGGDVYGWYRAAQPRSYYLSLGKSEGRIALINEILQAYDSQINFAQYDADHNGKMDALFIKWSGPDDGWGNFWWASMATQSFPLSFDGVTPYKYVWSWYSRPDGGVYKPQVDIHETGHLLGLPDYYDYDDTAGPKGGVGGWDMMDANWGDHNAFSKYLLGWIDPVVISAGSQEIVLPPSGTTSSENTVLIMPGASPDSFGEFFLVQYRERGSGNDPSSGGPDKAVWIWHVDSTLNGGGWGFQYDNSYTPHKLLRLMEADGLEEIETGTGDWDLNDFYHPGQVLEPVGVPNTYSYNGARTDVTVTNIQQLVSSMKVDFSILSKGPVAAFTGTPLTGTSPLGVTFIDTSTGSSVTNRHWDFGDGNTSDYAVATNPFHMYSGAGTYTVNLTVTNASGSDSRLRTDYVTVTAPPVAPVAAFTGTPLTGISPFTMTFTDTSTGSSITNRRWDFGDGNISNYTVATNPSHRYTGAGTYTVNLTVSGSAGNDSEVKPGYITVTNPVNLTSTIGIYRHGAIYLRNSNTGGNADVVFGYGNLAGDIPVTGDWDGNGTDTIGVFRNGALYLRNSNTNGFADLAFTYGQPGDVPITGDWDGNGIDSIGVFRNGVFYLRNSNSNGFADLAFTYGQPGDIPVVGDWDGNGIDSIGVFRNGVFYLRNSNSNGFADGVFGYGNLVGDIPVVGDWDGNGIDSIGVFRNGVFYLRNSNSNGFADLAFTYGQPGDIPITGNWIGT